jgi:mono/diheme cytochrome c family protein
MKHLKSPEVQAMSDTDIKNTIANGKGKMHPIKTVSGSDADDVAAYVHSLKK